MIIRVSAKLAKKIRESPAESLPLDPDPYADWSAHVFIANRLQYIIVANTISLYSVVFPGNGVTSAAILVERFLTSMKQRSSDDGYTKIFEERVVRPAGQVQVSKALNRSLVASMNELVSQSKFALIERGMPVDLVLAYLNETPFTTMFGRSKFGHPKEDFAGLDAFSVGSRGVVD